MHRYDDETVLQLYLSVKDGNEPMVNEIQRDAVDLLTSMARDGNNEASRALEDLAGAPMVHPILREQIRSMIGIPAPAR
jgi:hypothetical protein